jgi:hypothetical protein
VRARICRIARQRPEKFGLPFTTWSIAKLRDYLVKRRVVKTISKEQLRQILAEEGITFQKTKSWKESPDPEKEDKLARIEEVMEWCLDQVFAFDQLGPLNVVPTPGVSWAEAKRPQRQPANYHKFSGVRQFFACYHVGQISCGAGWRERRAAARPCGRSRASASASPNENGST